MKFFTDTRKALNIQCYTHVGVQDKIKSMTYLNKNVKIYLTSYQSTVHIENILQLIIFLTLVTARCTCSCVIN